MVVDDNKTMRVSLLDALNRCGYEVSVGACGDEGWELFQQDSFDLVITDCQMPKIDGWQLAKLIKSRSPHTPIIMITGQERDDVRDKLKQGYIDHLIPKPFELDDFYESVRLLLYKKVVEKSSFDMTACHTA